MSDRHLREIERAAATGDAEAARRLRRIKRRTDPGGWIEFVRAVKAGEEKAPTLVFTLPRRNTYRPVVHLLRGITPGFGKDCYEVQTVCGKGETEMHRDTLSQRAVHLTLRWGNGFWIGRRCFFCVLHAALDIDTVVVIAKELGMKRPF